MRWQPHLIERLQRVRDVRMRLAEMELAREDSRLAERREAEAQARDKVVTTTASSEASVAEADRTLLERREGGRHAITDWQGARKRAALAVSTAQSEASEAASERVDQELACSAARRQYRQMRLDVERMKLLCDGFGQGPA